MARSRSLLRKSCLLLSANPYDQRVFMNAMVDVAPNSLFLVAHNGREAIELLKEDGFTPDCAFVELNSPGIDGMEFLRAVKEVKTLRDVPVIIHHCEPAHHKTIELFELGAFAVYFQPYNYAGVCNILSVYLQQDIRTFLN